MFTLVFGFLFAPIFESASAMSYNYDFWKNIIPSAEGIAHQDTYYGFDYYKNDLHAKVTKSLEELLTQYNLESIKEKVLDFDKVIMATYNVCKDDYQTKVFNCLPKDKVTVVAMRSPYDIYHLEGLRSYICIYEASDLALNNLSLCLVGKEKFLGKLPVKLK